MPGFRNGGGYFGLKAQGLVTGCCISCGSLRACAAFCRIFAAWLGRRAGIFEQCAGFLQTIAGCFQQRAIDPCFGIEAQKAQRLVDELVRHWWHIIHLFTLEALGGQDQTALQGFC